MDNSTALTAIVHQLAIIGMSLAFVAVMVSRLASAVFHALGILALVPSVVACIAVYRAITLSLKGW